MATGIGETLNLEAVVLAGGAGYRFGGNKLSAAWRGGLLIDGALAAAFAAPARSVTVVTGADPKVAGAATAFAARAGQARRLRLIHATDHAEGMAASLRAGIAGLPADADGAFVFLGDMPEIPVAVLAPLAAALSAGATAAAPVHAGRRGHPVVFRRVLFDVLSVLHGDAGARALMDSLGQDLVLVKTRRPGVLLDIDRPEDLRP